MGIDAKLIGWALVFPRILDAITDPLMGNLSIIRSRFAVAGNMYSWEFSYAL